MMDSTVGYYKNSIGIASKSQIRILSEVQQISNASRSITQILPAGRILRDRIGFTDLGIIITFTTVDTSDHKQSKRKVNIHKFVVLTIYKTFSWISKSDNNFSLDKKDVMFSC
jgi:hypothetical protein